MSVAQASKRLTEARRNMFTAESVHSEAMKEWKAAIASFAKVEVGDLEFSNVVCNHNRHGGHVYKCESNLSQSFGNGNWRCVLCGLDDWSE